MINDVVCEHLVKKEKNAADSVKTAGIIIGAIVIIGLLFFAAYVFPAATALVIILVFAAIFGAVKLLQSLNIEYEYCFVNGDLTIDKIINQSDRRRIMVIDTKKIERAGRYSAADSGAFASGNVRNLSGSDDPEDGVFFQLRDEAGLTQTIVISCPEDYLLKMKAYFNQLVFREGFRK